MKRGNQPSLKVYLMDELKREGYLSLDKAHSIAKSLGHKESNAERRLRPSESPFAERVWNNPDKEDYIIGYKYKFPEPPLPSPMPIPKES